jgi:hypothetical protein
MTRAALLLAACCLLAACGKPGVPAEAEKARAALTGDDKQAAAANPQCQAFKPAEIAAYIGEPVKAGVNAASGLGCQWMAKDGSGDVIVSVVPAEYHEKPSAQKGYRTLPAPGSQAFIAPYFDGWLAGAITGASAVRVSTAGAKASEATTIGLLTESAKRLGK